MGDVLGGCGLGSDVDRRLLTFLNGPLRLCLCLGIVPFKGLHGPVARRILCSKL